MSFSQEKRRARLLDASAAEYRADPYANPHLGSFIQDIWSDAEKHWDKSGCQYCDGYCHGGCRAINQMEQG